MSTRGKLGSLTLVFRNPLVMRPISEFVTAIRQGNASNDDRNLANFFAYEDSRAGIGLPQGDIREDFDKLADSDGLIFDHFNLAIKPPAMATKAMSGATKTLDDKAVIRELDVDGTVRILMGFGHQLWYSNGTTAALTKTTADPFSSPRTVEDLIVYTDPTGGTKRAYIAQDTGDISYFTDPTASSPFTTVTNINGHGFFEFDGKLWLMGPGTLEWSIDPSNNAAWTAVTASGAWPNRWRFIGVFPFGETFYPYVLVNDADPSRTKIAVLNTDANELYPLDTGTPGVIDAWAHQGAIGIVYSSGRRAILWDPFNREPRELDWRATSRGGFLAARSGVIAGGAEHSRGALAFSNMSSSTACQVFQFKLAGWHPYGKSVAGDVLRGGRFIYHLNEIIFPVRPAGTDLQLNHIPFWDEAYTPGSDQGVAIESSDLSFITPWYSMGFTELAGILLGMNCGGFFDTANQITVKYQVDFNTAAWTTLGTFPNTDLPSGPEITGRTRAIEQDDFLLFNELVGTEFTFVRFQVTLVTTDANQSPNAYPLTLRFFKRPDLRESFSLDVDVLETLQQTTDLNSPDDIWIALKELYDQHQMQKLEIGPVTSWVGIISLPRVVSVGTMGGDDDIVQHTHSDEVSMIVEVAELI